MSGGATLGAILLAVCGGVLYHLSAKSVPSSLPPALPLIVAYAVALIVSALAYVAVPVSSGTSTSARLLHPAVIGLGLGAAMIELGYIVAYRSAAPVSATSVIVNGMVATMLVPVGILIFGEHLTWSRAAGLLLCLAGAWLLQRH